MDMNRIHIVPLILLLFLDHAHGQDRYFNDAFDYSIEFPKGWEVVEVTPYDAIVAISSRGNLVEIGVQVQPQSDMTEPSPTDIIDSLKKTVPTATIVRLDEGKTTFNGINAIWLVCSVNDRGNLFSLIYCFTTDSAQFRISGSTDGDSLYFENQREFFKDVIESFRFEEKE